MAATIRVAFILLPTDDVIGKDVTDIKAGSLVTDNQYEWSKVQFASYYPFDNWSKNVTDSDRHPALLI